MRMEKKSNVPQNTIVCKECEEMIDTAHECEGVKVLYGICEKCLESKKR